MSIRSTQTNYRTLRSREDLARIHRLEDELRLRKEQLKLVATTLKVVTLANSPGVDFTDEHTRRVSYDIANEALKTL